MFGYKSQRSCSSWVKQKCRIFSYITENPKGRGHRLPQATCAVRRTVSFSSPMCVSFILRQTLLSGCQDCSQPLKAGSLLASPPC